MRGMGRGVGGGGNGGRELDRWMWRRGGGLPKGRYKIWGNVDEGSLASPWRAWRHRGRVVWDAGMLGVG